MYNILQKYFSGLVFLIKVLILAGAYFVISEKLLHDAVRIGPHWQERIETLGTDSVSFVMLLSLCTLFNWIMEIAKWKFLVRPVAALSSANAAKQSLASLTASLLTPNRIGEYGAKAVYYNPADRPRILLYNFLGNASQMLVTVFFGLVGIWYLWDLLLIDFNSYTIALGLALSFLILSGALFLYGTKKWNALRKLVSELANTPFGVYHKTFLFSAARYLIFSHQFYLFLVFFGVETTYALSMALITSMYLISSVIPGFVLFDWLVKGSVAVTLFSMVGINETLVLSITASMWILNFAIPAVIGSYYVITFKSSAIRFRTGKIVK